MPTYEYLCRQCDTRFEARRSMAEADRPVSCPSGHHGATRVFSVFASVSSSNGSNAPAPVPSAPCGASCACHPG